MQDEPRRRLLEVEERSLFVGREPWRLPGTLCIGAGRRGCPALVLIHGWGPQDQDHRFGPHHTFRDLAWELAARGVAVLRYPKRTHYHRARYERRIDPQWTLDEEAVEDGVAALEVLRQIPEVDERRLGLLGYSLGTVAAPRIARRFREQRAQADGPTAAPVRWLVLVAGSPRPVERCLLEQARWLARGERSWSAHYRRQLPAIEREAERIAALVAGAPCGVQERLLGRAPAYWLDLAAHPIAAMLDERSPSLLVVHPGRDYRVSDGDLQAWRALLSHHPDAEIRSFPELNHQLVPGELEPSPEDEQRPGSLGAALVDAVVDWLHERG